MPTYAIIETGGKQYRVAAGDVIDVDKLKTAITGDTIQLDKVLLLSQEGNVSVGTPLVAGAHVVAKVETEAKGEKLIIFKYKPKVRYRKKTGHRQTYSRLAIQSIETGAGSHAAAHRAAPRRRTVARKTKEKAQGDGS